jgi:hypothetical protein
MKWESTEMKTKHETCSIFDFTIVKEDNSWSPICPLLVEISKLGGKVLPKCTLNEVST